MEQNKSGPKWDTKCPKQGIKHEYHLTLTRMTNIPAKGMSALMAQHERSVPIC